MAASKNPQGRPSSYSEEAAEKIISLLSDGIPLRAICRDNDDLPAWRTVYDWMGKNPSFSTRIAHAREVGFDAIAEEALMIADTPCYLETKETTQDDGKPAKVKVVVADAFNHRRLQVDTRLKLLAKWNPKKYGDQLQFDTENMNWTVNGIPVKTNK